MKKIMYFPYGGGHGNIAKCLYKGFENRSVEQKIVALTVSWRIFEDNNIPYVRLGNYKNVIKEWDKIQEIGKNLAKDISFDNPDLLFEDYCSYLGIGYYSLIVEHGKEEAAKMYRELGRRAFCPVPVMKEILEYERPDAVIITCGVRTEKAVGIAANELGIPVFRMADLYEFEPSGCDAYTCVMNEYAKRFAVNKLGIDSNKVFVTGQPVFENNNIIDDDKNQRVREDLSLDNYDKVIIYLEQPELKETEYVEKELINIANKHASWMFIFKQHPNQTGELEEGLPSNVRCLRKYPLNYLLFNCDLAITRDSTAGLEAVLFDKPLISTAFSNTDKGFPKADLDYSRLEISYSLDRPSDLYLAIDKCLDKNNKIAISLKNKRDDFKNATNVCENVYSVIFEVLNN